jgi:ornithine cyclodeaminase/alanine dehydrogenase-like protein (mu-crystallin family)
MPQQPTLLLTHHDVATAVATIGVDVFMRELIDELHAAFASFSKAEFDVPIRTGFHYDEPHAGLIEWMPLHRHEQAVFIKTVGYHPSNPVARNLPTVISTFNRFDPTTGKLLAVADGALLTALRTGAASAVATRLLADLSGLITLGLIGCGAQAVSQLHAIMQVADVAEILVFDANPKVSDSFANRIAMLNHGDVPVRVSSVADIVQESDVMCTATSIAVGEGPLFGNLTLKNDVHINAVGSDLPGKIELPISLLRNSFVCPDFPEQAILEGECQQLSRNQIGPSIMEVAADPKSHSQVKSQRTVFDSTGWALEDYVATQLLMRYADELKLGSKIALAGSNSDPWNPYAGISNAVAAGVS